MTEWFKIKNIQDIQAFALECFSSSRGSHDWEHTRRVVKLCLHIGNVEGGDREVLEIASLLHDVGRPYQDQSRGAICHAMKGAEMAGSILEAYPISRDKKENIIHCIRSHRFRGNGRPETLEARVLFDADKLDAIGAIGIGRAFHFAGEVGAKFHNPDVNVHETQPYTAEDTGYREFKVKLSKIKDRMLTGEGLRLARARHDFMEAFFERFFEEYEGRK